MIISQTDALALAEEFRNHTKFEAAAIGEKYRAINEMIAESDAWTQARFDEFVWNRLHSAEIRELFIAHREAKVIAAIRSIPTDVYLRHISGEAPRGQPTASAHCPSGSVPVGFPTGAPKRR